MTNKQQSQKTMFTAFYLVLTGNAQLYANDVDFKAEVDAFIAAYIDNNNKATAAHADNSGFSSDKLNHKIILSDLVSRLAGKAYVKFNNLDMPSLAEQLHIEPTDYKQEADSQTIILAQQAHDLMHSKLSLLSPTGTITALMLTNLQDEIDKFTSLQGSSDTVHEVSSTLTKEFNASFKPVILRINNLKLLLRDYKTINLTFFDNAMASTVVPTINVHHTYVSVHCYGKSSGRLIEGAVFTLTKGKKSASTDWEGDAEISEVKCGKDILTGVFQEKTFFEAHIVIKRGRDNQFEAAIEEM